MDKCLITACSNKYFPSVLNLIGSLAENYPDHTPVYVYDLGLNPFLRRTFERLRNVTVLPLPPFCPFWRSCYTWKTYIFTKPLARLNFYLDAGTEVLGPLDRIYDLIEADDYFAVDQEEKLAKITPPDYPALFGLDKSVLEAKFMAAGIFGFKDNSRVTPALVRTYEAALAGFGLGFSPAEGWRNKGRDKSVFVRNCPVFRHDQTLLNLALRQELGELNLQSKNIYSGSGPVVPGQLIRLLGRSYESLEPARRLLAPLGRTAIFLLDAFLFLKKARLAIKRALGLTRN